MADEPSLGRLDGVILYYDREGRPLDLDSLGKLLADQEYKRVAEDQVGPYWVSTVWLGIDHGFGRFTRGAAPAPPVIFETMVFAPDDITLGPELDCQRYCTEEDARAGHEEMVLLVRATLQELPEARTEEASE